MIPCWSVAGPVGNEESENVIDPVRLYAVTPLTVPPLKLPGWLKYEVVLQVSKADKYVTKRLPCVIRLPSQKGCR